MEFAIRRMNDAALFKLMSKAEAAGKRALEKAEKGGTLSSTSCSITVNWSSSLPWQITKEDLDGASPDQYSVQSVSLSFNAQGQVTNGQIPSASASFVLIRGNGDVLTDKVRIQSDDRYSILNGEGEREVLRAIHKAFSAILQPVAPEDGGLIPTLSNLTAAFGATYQQITHELSRAVTAIGEEHSRQSADLSEERKRLRADMEREKDALLAEAKTRLEVDEARIATEKQEIADARAQLEVSSHKDARRKQFGEMKDQLESLMNTPVTGRDLRMARWAVFFAFCIAGGLAGTYTIVFISAAAKAGQLTGGALILDIIRLALFAATSVGAFVAAAYWLRYFYVRDLQTQENLVRFRNDMARASWIMDAALEIRKEHGEEIPPEWIAGVTRDLFAASHTKDTVEEGVQAMAALLGLSASASFGPGGVTVDLGKKGGKAIAGSFRGSE